MHEKAPRRKPLRAPKRAALAGLTWVGLAAGATSAPADPPSTADNGELSLAYSISIAGLPIGKALAQSRFTSAGYALSINGFTSGLSRIVSDAKALLASNGRIAGGRVMPLTYSLDTTEDGQAMHVRMRMSGGRITAVQASPDLEERADRVPVREEHKRNVVDPVSAFIMPVGTAGRGDGEAACARTVSVFDGWERFDIRLFFKEQKTVSGGDGSYSGPVFVCGARYVPVSGHVAGRDEVKYMADNKDLEVWLAPLEAIPVFVPYQIRIGTRVGTLSIHATKFVQTNGVRRAAAN